MDIDAQQVIREQMSAGERLLWAGRPATGLALKRSDTFMIPFSLLWGGFAIFWEIMVFRSDAPRFMLLFGGVFVCIGLYLIFGRFFVDAWMRSKTWYGVTDSRALIVRRTFGSSVKSLHLKAVPEISIDEKPSGRGTITFGPTGMAQAWFQATMWTGNRNQASPAFELIADVKQVYEIIRRAQSSPAQ